MNRLVLPIVVIAALAGCASRPPAGQAASQTDQEIYTDAAGPASGVHIGIGAGSWGGRSGGGVGIGLGF